MPIIILTVRVQLEMLYKMHFRAFLGRADKAKGDKHQTLAMRLINGVITEVFDPNIFFSRLSFLESGKDALDIKNFLNQGRAYKGYKLPNIKDKFYTRSALVKNLIPMPSDGKFRSRFTERKGQIQYPPLKYKKDTKSYYQNASPTARESLFANGQYLAEPILGKGSPISQSRENTSPGRDNQMNYKLLMAGGKD